MLACARRSLVFALSIVVLVPGVALPRVDRPEKSENTFICGTSPERTRDALARGRYRESRIFSSRIGARPRVLLAAEPVALQRDVGDVAVLDDDGTLVTEPNFVDLTQRSFLFERTGDSTYTVVPSNAVFDPTGGVRVNNLGDDDYRTEALGYFFPFFGRDYSVVYVNSDGNLTFGQSDTAHTERDLGRFASGPPRIGPFFTDLDPQGGRVFIRTESDGLTFIWDSVPAYGTQQYNSFSVKLFRNGNIEFAFGSTLSTPDAVTGISPGSFLGGISAVDYSQDIPTASLGGTIVEVFSSTFSVSETGIARKFFETHPDVFDHLTIFLNFSFDLGGNAYAYELNVKNEITGIGLPVDDMSADYGSNGRLRSLLNMGTLSGPGRYPANPNQIFLGTNSTITIMGQESGHRWLAFTPFLDGSFPSTAILGRDLAHWSFFFDSDGSVMEGNDIQDRGSNLGMQEFITVGATYTYSKLDQYIMGLLGKEDVSPMLLVENKYGTTRTASSAPEIGVTFGGTPRSITIDSIIAANGTRIPSVYQSPKVFRQAFILVSKQGLPATADQIAKVQRIRDEWVNFFNEETGGRGWLVTDLQATAGTTPSRMLIPYFQGDSQRFTGIAVANWGTTPADVTFTAYNNNGTPLSTPGNIINPRVITIAPSAQVALLAEQIHDLSLQDPRNGWIQANSTSSQVTGFFLDGDLSQTLLDGAVASDNPQNVLYFSRLGASPNSRTLIDVVNPAGSAAQLTLTLQDAAANVLATASRTLNAHGRLAQDLASLFPGIPQFGPGGYVKVSSNTGMVGYLSIESTGSVSSLPAQSPADGSRLYSAQFASGRAGTIRYFTELNFINTSQQRRTLVVTLVGNDGIPVSTASNPFTVSLDPGHQYKARGEAVFGLPDAAFTEGLTEGSVTIDSDGPGILGDVTFGDPVTGQFVASLPYETRPSANIVLSQVAQGAAGGTKPYFTGIAMYNPNPAGVSITIDVFSEKGVKTGTATRLLAGGNRVSKTLPELVPAITNQARGYIRLTSDGGPIVAFELFGDQALDFLAAVPPQPINP
jgi:hypothetical protein